MLYEMLSGRLPYEADNYNTLIAQLLMSPPTPITVRVSDLPPEMALVVERAIAKDPAERFGGAEEFRTSLEPFAGATFVPSAQARTATPTATPMAWQHEEPDASDAEDQMRPSRKRGPWLALGGVVAAVGIVVAIVVARGGTKADRTPAALAASAKSIAAPIAPPPAPAPSPTPVAAAAADAMTLHVEVTPPGARIAVDGASAPGPIFDGRFAKDGMSHVVEATADGYESARRRVTFDLDRSLTIALRKQRASPSRQPKASAKPPPEEAPPPPTEERTDDRKKIYSGKKHKIITDYP